MPRMTGILMNHPTDLSELVGAGLQTSPKGTTEGLLF